MLPYTTYIIPETPADKTSSRGKKIWFVLQETPGAHHSVLLERIAAALQTNLKTDVFCLLTGSGDPVSVSLYEDFPPGLLMSFGVPPADLGIRIDMPRQGICFFTSAAMILTGTPEDLDKNQTMKKQLWAHIQQYLEYIHPHG